MRPSAGRQLAVLMRAELTAERRAGEVLLTTLPFAAGGLLVVALAVGADVPLLRRIGPGIYWALVLLLGCLVALRRTVSGQGPRRDLVYLLGVDPVVTWGARAAAAAVLVLAVEVGLAPVAVALYDPPLAGLPALALAGLLVAVGLGGLATLAADLVAGPRSRTGLVPLIVTPLAVPLALAAVQIGEGATYDASPAPWLALAGLVDLLVALGGLLTARLLTPVTP